MRIKRIDKESDLVDICYQLMHGDWGDDNDMESLKRNLYTYNSKQE